MWRMQLTARQEFAAPPARVYAMCIDPEFLALAARDIGAFRHTVEVVPGGAGVLTRVSVETETVPVLVPLAGRTLTLGQEMDWAGEGPDGAREARLVVKVAGFPVVMDARARLAPTASGCAIDYAGDLRVAVPVLGGTIERQAAPYVLEVLGIQQRTGAAWLARHP